MKSWNNLKELKNIMEMEIKLKSCPFCGARSLMGNGPRLTDFNITTSGKTIYEVYCTNCTATINRWFDSEEEAAKAWNKQTEPEKNKHKHGTWLYDEAEEMFYCSECREYVVSNVYNYCMWCGAKMDKKVSE